MRARLVVFTVVLATLSVSPYHGNGGGCTAHVSPWLQKDDIVWEGEKTELFQAELVALKTIPRPTDFAIKTRIVIRSPLDILDISKPHTIHTFLPNPGVVECYHVTLIDEDDNQYNECISLPHELSYKQHRVRIESPDLPPGVYILLPPFAAAFLFNTTSSM